MQFNQNFQFKSTDLNETVSAELGTFFDSVMSTVADYFEEAILE